MRHFGLPGDAMRLPLEWILTRGVAMGLLALTMSGVARGRAALADQLAENLAVVVEGVDETPSVQCVSGDGVRGEMPDASNAPLMSTWQVRPVFSM